MKSSASFHALRLRPGQLLKEELMHWAAKNKIEAASIVSCVGSLQKACIRLADKNEGSTFEGKYEITSLSGTLSQHGIHVHISIADGNGEMIGGHLLDGCEIYTTCELVLAELDELIFKRHTDPATGYLELSISAKPSLKKD